jgi:hypothetical protein
MGERKLGILYGRRPAFRLTFEMVGEETKKTNHQYDSFQPIQLLPDYFLCVDSSDTDSFFLPLALLEPKTLRPFADAILDLNPCLLLLFLLEG